MASRSNNRNEQFRELYDSHATDVHRYIARRVRTDGNQAIEDLSSDVFMTAYRRLDDVLAADHPRAWLLGVARRTVANHHRTTQRRTGILERFWRDTPAADIAEPIATSAAVQAAMARLATADQELLRLTAWEQLTVAEIAVVLDIKPATVSVRLHRARQRFAAAYLDGNTDDERGRRDREPDNDQDRQGPEGQETAASRHHQDTTTTPDRPTAMQRHDAQRHKSPSQPPPQTDVPDRARIDMALTALAGADPFAESQPHEPWRTRERIITAGSRHAKPVVRIPKLGWLAPAALAVIALAVIAPWNTTPGQQADVPLESGRTRIEQAEDGTQSAAVPAPANADTHDVTTTAGGNTAFEVTVVFDPAALIGLPVDKATVVAAEAGYAVTTDDQLLPSGGRHVVLTVEDGTVIDARIMNSDEPGQDGSQTSDSPTP